jgi:hypothetical protein
MGEGTHGMSVERRGEGYGLTFSETVKEILSSVPELHTFGAF